MRAIVQDHPAPLDLPFAKGESAPGPIRPAPVVEPAMEASALYNHLAPAPICHALANYAPASERVIHPLPSNGHAQASESSAAGDPFCSDVHTTGASHRQRGVGANPSYDRDAWLRLRSISEMHFAAQVFRISLGNQMLHAPDLVALMAEPEKAEANLRLAMVRQLRVTAPKALLDWQKASGGIGESTLARLLGAVGHPVIATPFHWQGVGPKRELVADLPFLRTLRQLWQFCGHGDPSRSKRSRGMSAEEVAAAGKPMAKMLVHLMAESAIKQPQRCWTAGLGGHWKDLDLGAAQPSGDSQLRSGGSEPSDPASIDSASAVVPAAPDLPLARAPKGGATAIAGSARTIWAYRQAYELRRDATVYRTHAAECVRCGPAGRPAAEGSPWSAAHQHADALRVVGKEVLRDLWRVASEATGE